VSDTSGLDVKRVFVAVFLLVYIMTAVFYGGILLASFLGFFVFVGTKELVAIAKTKGLNPPFWFILGSNFILLSLAAFKMNDLIFGVFTFIAFTAFLLILFRGKDARLNDLSMTILAIIYASIFPLHTILIRNLEFTDFTIMEKSFPIGIGIVVLVFFATAMCDIGAFYSGKTFGKHPLWKAISPKKTIEGSIGGTLLGTSVAVLVGYFIGLSFIQSLIGGLLVTIAGQLGDLAESMIKRDAGIKDSGDVFPGHGGVLDRADSYVFAVIIGYFYFKFVIMFDIFANSLIPFH